MLISISSIEKNKMSIEQGYDFVTMVACMLPNKQCGTLNIAMS